MTEVHELAELVPPMAEKDYPAFRDDIRDNGLSLPITIYEGKILDGRTRQRACDEAGVEPSYEDFNGGDPVAFVVSRNLHRRHLTIAQRAVIGDRLLPHFEAKARERMQEGGKKGGESKGRADPPTPSKPRTRERRARTEAAEAVGIGPRTLAAYERLKNEDVDLLDRVHAGELAIDTAEKLLRPKKNGKAKRRPTFDPATDKGQVMAKKARQRMETITGTLEGLAQGFDERAIQIDLALAIAEEEEIERWVKSLTNSARSIRNYAKHIDNRRNHGTAA